MGSEKTGVAVPPQAATRRRTASVEPIVSASGFSCPTARTRRAALIRATTASGTAGVHGERSITAGASSSRCVARPMTAGRGAGAGAWHVLPDARSPGPAPRPRRLRAAAGRPASGATRRSGGDVLVDPALLELVEQLEDAGPPLERCRRAPGGTPGSACRRSRLPSSWRTNGIARPIAASVAFRSSGWPMTLTETRACRRSGAVSTSVIVANPIRGSSTSRRKISPISWRNSSSIDQFAASSVPARACRPATARPSYNPIAAF